MIRFKAIFFQHKFIIYTKTPQVNTSQQKEPPTYIKLRQQRTQMTPPPSISKSQDSNDNLSISSITRKIAHLSNNNSQEDDNCDGDDYAPSGNNTSTNNNNTILLHLETLLAVNISEAICRGNLQDLELILKGLQLTPNNFDSSYGNLLHIAASLAPLDTFKRILQWTELSPNSRSSQDGSTVLHIVTKLDRLEIVEFLLSLPEIDDGITDNQGKTCIDYCTSKRCKQLFQSTSWIKKLKIPNNL